MILNEKQIFLLSNCEVEGNKILLPEQLDRKNYLDIKKVLETIGAKWNRKEKAHIADMEEEDIVNALADIIKTGEVETLQDTIKKFQFYPTPEGLAQELVSLADIQENDTILEPSAGLGNIVKETSLKNHITMIELDEEKYNKLKEKYKKNCEILNMDFLDYTGKTFDKIIANPPFAKSQDVKHILHMYSLLNERGRLISIASASIKTRQGKLYDQLRDLNPGFIKIEDGTFKDSGTMANTLIVILEK